MSGTDKIPRHVAIIMDGNGRWAKSRGQERLYGHVQGAESLRKVLTAAPRYGVKYLTFYAFSTENWGRPREEVDGLMELLCETTVNELEGLIENGVRVAVIGDRTKMSAKVCDHIDLLEERTAKGERITLVLALNYGSREEIANAVKHMAGALSDGRLKPEDITPESIAQNLYTSNIPDPDLLIRTSGEQRLSNFLLWQSAYTELYFTNTLWPDFGEADFVEALNEYARRERRYGLITEQKS